MLYAFTATDVLDNAFQRHWFTIAIKHGTAALGDPGDVAVGAHNAVFQLKTLAFFNRSINHGARLIPVIRMRDDFVRGGFIEQQLMRRIASEGFAALAHINHGPVAVIQAAVNHAIQVIQQRIQQSLLLRGE